MASALFFTAYGCRYCAPLKRLVSFSSNLRPPRISLLPNPRICKGTRLLLRMERFWTRGGIDKNKVLVENLQNYGIINSKKVAEVMETIDRGLFVPDGNPPYFDSPMPIGYNATISAPHMHATCLELLERHLQPGMRALDVGSGTGYLTACFAMMVGPEGRAVGVEHIPELVASSMDNIKRSAATPLLEQGSLSVHVGDGRLGWQEHAPYDAIHVGAAAPEIPQPLLNQLKPGGRMVIPVGNVFQDLKVIDKNQDGSVDVRRNFCSLRSIDQSGFSATRLLILESPQLNFQIQSGFSATRLLILESPQLNFQNLVKKSVC